MARIARKVRDLALVLFAMVVYYTVALPLLLPATDTLVNVLASHNLTSIDIPQKEYTNVNGTWTWVEQPVTIDLAGLIHFIMILAVSFAPILIVWRLLL